MSDVNDFIEERRPKPEKKRLIGKDLSFIRLDEEKENRIDNSKIANIKDNLNLVKFKVITPKFLMLEPTEIEEIEAGEIKNA